MATLAVGLASLVGAFGSTAGLTGAALAAAQTAIAATTFAFSTIAAAIDNFLLFPALFPPEDIKGDRVSDFQLSTASEGSARNHLFGEQNRVAGQVTWIGTTQEIVQTTGGGKKEPEITEYTYFVNLAIEVSTGVIASLDRIWADGRIIYINPDKPALSQVTVGGTDLAFNAIHITPGAGPTASWATASSYYPGNVLHLSTSQSPSASITSSSIDLSVFKPGDEITVEGFAASENNTDYVLADAPAPGSPLFDNQVGQSGAGAPSVPSLITPPGPYHPQRGDRLFWKVASAGTGPSAYYVTLKAFSREAAPGTAITQLNSTGGAGNDQYNFWPNFVNWTQGPYPQNPPRPSGFLPAPSSNQIDAWNVSIPNWWEGVSEAVGANVTLTGASSDYRPDLISGITIYDGTQTTVDPLIDAEEAIVPAFTGRSYFVLESLNLTEFGNRLPQFSVQVSEEDSKSVATTISDILLLSGLTADQFDVTALTGITMEGYNIVGVQQPRSSLQPIMMTYNVAVQEDNEKLVFYIKENAETVALDTDLIGTQDSGSPGSFVSADARDRPSRIEVKYIDPALNLQAGSQVYRKVASPEQGILNADLQVTMSAVDAQCRARRMLWASWANSRSFATEIAPRYYNVLPGDVVTFSYNVYDGADTAVSASVRAFILKATRGENGLIEIEGVIEDPAPFVSQLCEVDTNPGFLPAPPPGDPGFGSLALLDVAPLSNAELFEQGTYLSTCLENPAAGWQGASIYRALGGPGYTSTTFEFWRTMTFEGVMGVTTSQLTAAEDYRGVMDRVNTVDVEMLNGTPGSISLAELNEGANIALVGQELLAFQTATLQADGTTYRLSNLLRGLKGTRTGVFGIGQNFTLINTQALEFFEFVPGQGMNFKIVPVGASVAATSAVFVNSSGVATNVAMQGNNARPAPVVIYGATRDGTGNVTIRFERTTRAWVRGIASTRPLLDENAVFGFRLYFASGGWVPTVSGVNFIVSPQALMSSNRGYEYTMTVDQLAGHYPGYAGGDPVYVEAFQMVSSGSLLSGIIFGRSFGVITL